MSMIRCVGIRMGKVQKRVLRVAGYMSTFVIGIWTQPKSLKATNRIQLHKNMRNANLGEQLEVTGDLLLTMKRYLLP